MVLKIMTGEEVAQNATLVEDMITVHCSNNACYQPTLLERHMAIDEEDLRSKVKGVLLARCLKGYTFIVSMEKGKVVGFSNFTIKEKMIKGDLHTTLELGTSSVCPKHQNKGIGKSMYALMEGYGVGHFNVTAVTRITWSTNLRQCHLYAEFGYRVYIREYSYYGVEGLDRLHYYKIFSH